MSPLIAPGAPAPPFRAVGSDGGVHELGRLLAASRVLLVFYPGNNTPG